MNARSLILIAIAATLIFGACKKTDPADHFYFNATVGGEVIEIDSDDNDDYMIAEYDSIAHEIVIRARRNSDKSEFRLEFGGFSDVQLVRPGDYRANSGCEAWCHLASDNGKFEGSWTYPDWEHPQNNSMNISSVESRENGNYALTGTLDDGWMMGSTDSVYVEAVDFRVLLQAADRGSEFKSGFISAEIDGDLVNIYSDYNVFHDGGNADDIYVSALRNVLNDGFTINIPAIDRPAALRSYTSAADSIRISFRRSTGCGYDYFFAGNQGGTADLEIQSVTEEGNKFAVTGTFSGAFSSDGLIADTVQVSEGNFLFYY